MRSILVTMFLACSLAGQTPRAVQPRLDGAEVWKVVEKQAPPVYPPNLLADTRIQGTVHLVVVVDKTGKLENAQVTSGPALLRQAALDCIQKWTFRPYLLNGKPSAAMADFDIVFKLP